MFGSSKNKNMMDRPGAPRSLHTSYMKICGMYCDDSLDNFPIQIPKVPRPCSRYLKLDWAVFLYPCIGHEAEESQDEHSQHSVTKALAI
jgi:hypothetical protein